MSPDRPSLKVLVLRGSAWTIAGSASGQLIRLAKSLIVTRLLFPEAFGLMSLVWVVIFGLEMLSDLGVASAIIRDKRGDEPDFLNTAWTLQAMRGALLWGVSCVIAGPMAGFYGQPELAQLVPVAGLTALIAGFNSTALHTCRRRMEFGQLTLLEVANELVGFVVVVLWAFLYPSVWALVGGALAGSLFAALASHAFLPGIRNRFRWEPSSLRALIGFGKWIFLGSAFGFLSVQGDRLLLGRYLDMTRFGTYSIAVMLTDALNALVLKINHGVLFPAYAKVMQNDPQRLRSVFYRGRLGVDLLLIFPIGVLMVLGRRVVEVLYDQRYHEAGWMLEALCVRLIISCALSNSEACLVALGQPQYSFFQRLVRAAWILVAIPVGWSLMEIKGAVWAVALSELAVIGVLWVGLVRHRMFSLGAELRSVLFAGLGAVSGLGLLRLLP
jgi:O-antigen/teichoic acid export membrane protein